MTREEFLEEYEGAQKQMAPETAQRVLSRLLDLTRLCMETGHHDWGLEVVDYSKPRLIRMMFEASGMDMRELNDFLLNHNEYSDWRYKMYWDFVLEETYDRFIPFMEYMERKRPFAKKFYEPRAFTKDGKVALLKVAKELQNLEYGLYKFLGVSLPARVGKSTICIFFLCWIANRHPNAHNAMGGHAGTLVKGFYKELLNFMTSEEYMFAEIYSRWHPSHVMIRDKSAEDYTITLDEPDRFATITCRGIDATWTGAVDVSQDGILYVDDLIRDRQHSLSPSRMEETYQEYLNKMVDRMNDGAKQLMVGTLWNVSDPLERIRKLHENDPDYKFLRIPALDDDDESNFDYLEKGFSTKYYKDMRDTLDDAEWQAKFQQRPYVREGLLFPSDELKYFDGVVYTGDIKRVFAVIDVAVGGGDNLSMPICAELNSGRKLIIRWIYDKHSTAVTVPRVVDAIIREVITEVRIEHTGVGFLFEDALRKELNDRAVYFCKVISVNAPNRMSKEDKINGYSDRIKSNFEFLSPTKASLEEADERVSVYRRDADYQRAMDDMSMYTSIGKNTNDDAPDSMAQLEIMCEKRSNGQVNPIHIEGGL